MSTTALGIAPDEDGNGVTPLTHRRVQMYQWENTGVVGGLGVSGGTDLTYTVDAGMAVTSRGDSDGYCLAYSEGGTVETEAGDSSNPRYDVVWIRSNDLSQGDETNTVELGCTQGSPAASPSVPDLEAGEVACDTLYVPAGMTMTSSCTSTGDVGYAIPYGTSLGLVGQKVITNNEHQWSDNGSFRQMAACTFSAPTDRHIGIKVTITAGAINGTYTDDGEGSVYVRLLNDGETIETREIRLVKKGNAVSQFYEVITDVLAGSHTITMQWQLSNCDYAYLYYSSSGWAGQRLDIVDYGVAE